MARAGQFRNLITVKSLTTGRSVNGGVTETWATHCTCWARIVPVNGTERDASNQVRGETTYQITVRHSTDVSTITPEMKIERNGVTFDIDSIVPDERDKVILITAIVRQS